MAIEDETPEEFLAKLEALGRGELELPAPIDVPEPPTHIDPNTFHGRWWELEAERREVVAQTRQQMAQYLTLSAEERKAWDDADPMNRWLRAQDDWLQTQRSSLP